MNKDSKSKKVLLLLILVLTISIGYAAIASTLKINGNTTVKGLNWSIYWDNVVPTEGSVTGANVVTAPTTSGTTTTTIDFSVILPEPGDFYEFEVDAVNAGTIDAMIADEGIIKKAYSDANYTNEVTLPDVVRYTVTYQDGTAVEPNHLLAKKDGNTPTRERYKVRVEYRNDDEIDPDDLDGTNDRQYYLRFQVEYVQANDNAVAKNGNNETPSNPYETTFDGNYTYANYDTYEDNGEGGFVPVEFSNEWNTYFRNDGTKDEVCVVYPSGTVCATSAENGRSSDFEDVSDSYSNITTTSGLAETGLKGYSLAKAQEMLNNGATSCNVYGNYLCCDTHMINEYGATGPYLTIRSDGNIESSDGQGNFLLIGSNGSLATA